MYFYKFESIDFEEQYAFELKHAKKFSRDDLDTMVIRAIRIYVERDYDVSCLYPFPCHMDMGDLFFNGALKDTLVREFGFLEIDYETSISYGAEAFFSDDFRHRDGVNFKEILKDVKVPKCISCCEEKCPVENERF